MVGNAAKLLAGAVVAIASCTIVNPPIVVLHPAAGESQLASLTGRLEIRGECIVVVDPAGQVHTVAWPSPGTHWDAAFGRIGIGDVTASMGQSITLTGGSIDSPRSVDLSDWITQPPEACLDQPLWVASIMNLAAP